MQQRNLPRAAMYISMSCDLLLPLIQPISYSIQVKCKNTLRVRVHYLKIQNMASTLTSIHNLIAVTVF